MGLKGAPYKIYFLLAYENTFMLTCSFAHFFFFFFQKIPWILLFGLQRTIVCDFPN